MSKWEWIAQETDGYIFFYDEEPLLMPFGFIPNGKDLKLVAKGKPNPNFRETLINLETEDYEINDGILTRIPRKNKLDKLIANVKKINKKAAKWMNKNRCKLEDVYYIEACFDWDICEKHDWCYIYDELIKLEQDPEPAKETLTYRVGFYFYNDDAKHLFLVTNQEHADLEEKNPGFVKWVADWIEVEV